MEPRDLDTPDAGAGSDDQGLSVQVLGQQGRNSEPCGICGDLRSDSGSCRLIEGSVHFAIVETSAGRGCTGCQLVRKIAAHRWQKMGEKSQDLSISLNAQVDSYVDLIKTSTGQTYRYCLYTERETPWTSVPIVNTNLRRTSPSLSSATKDMKLWLQKCAGHIRCNMNYHPRLPTRVIEVGSSSSSPRLYISQGESARYVALSHCWGPPDTEFQRLVTTKTNIASHRLGIPLPKFPRTFRQAIELVRELDIQYLWIDSLCIIQGDQEDWEREASRMADVYSNAFLTLAADWEPSSAAGLFASETWEPRNLSTFTQHDQAGDAQKITAYRMFHHSYQYTTATGQTVIGECNILRNRSALKRRAWTLQERLLSRRIVHCGNAELVWECTELGTAECSCGWQNKKYLLECTLGVLQDVKDNELLNSQWRCIVEDYTSLDMTLDRDRLPAIAGLAKRFPLQQSDYVAGMWRTGLNESLNWVRYRSQTKKVVTRMPRDYAPTWSWASIVAPVYFKGIGATKSDHWEVTGLSCPPSDADPYGPVADAKLDILGYLIPITHFHNRIYFSTDEDSLDREYIRPIGNNVSLDTGDNSSEWKDDNYDYYVFPTMTSTKRHKYPSGPVLRRSKADKTNIYSRIGHADLNAWGRDWRPRGSKEHFSII